jgi:hypothetical protein
VFQKYAPLLILVLFAIGAYFMVQGMQEATSMATGAKAP